MSGNMDEPNHLAGTRIDRLPSAQRPAPNTQARRDASAQQRSLAMYDACCHYNSLSLSLSLKSDPTFKNAQ
jgi:hypothetical protein